LAFSNAAQRARIARAWRVAPSPISVSIDLNAPGKRIGHLELVWSDDEHAYGVIPVPIAVIANGNGPSALVTAGVHGDEYEGLVITRKLISEIMPEALTGRIVIMPGVNWPAVRARRRVSPIDGKNMNRAFPGDSTSGPTAMIADFIERRLVPGASYAVDLHSGGTQSVYTPCGYVYGTGERAFRERKLAAAHAFGAPDRGRDHNVVRCVAVCGVRTARSGHGCGRTWRRRGARPRRNWHRLGRHAQPAAPCGRADRRTEADAHGAAAYSKPGVLRHGDDRRPVRAFGRRWHDVRSATSGGRIWP
jgi:hypothetical protein